MSWNGYPKSFRNFTINKLLNKSSNNPLKIDSLTGGFILRNLFILYFLKLSAGRAFRNSKYNWQLFCELEWYMRW